MSSLEERESKVAAELAKITPLEARQKAVINAAVTQFHMDKSLVEHYVYRNSQLSKLSQLDIETIFYL